MHGTTTIPGTQDDSCMEGKGASKTPALSLVLELVCWIEYIPFVRRSSFDAVPGLMLPTILLPFTLMLDLAARMPNPPPLSTSSPHPPRLRSMATPGPFCWLIAMPQPRKVLPLLFLSSSVARLSWRTRTTRLSAQRDDKTRASCYSHCSWCRVRHNLRSASAGAPGREEIRHCACKSSSFLDSISTKRVRQQAKLGPATHLGRTGLGQGCSPQGPQGILRPTHHAIAASWYLRER
jgi:hypothetical protein